MSTEEQQRPLVNNDIDNRAIGEKLAELTELITVGLESGDPFEIGAPYWAEKHRQLAQRLRDLET